MSESVLHWITHYGYAGLFSLLVLGIVGLPLPDEVLLIFAGSLVDKGELRLMPTVVAALGGSMSGITCSYGLGRLLGVALLRRFGHLFRLTSERVEDMHTWFARWGKWGLICGFFIPGVRHLTAYAAGTSGLALPVFALFAYSGALLWSVTFVGLGYMVGEEWPRFSAAIHRHLLAVSGLVVVLVASYLLWRWKYSRRAGQPQAP